MEGLSLEDRKHRAGGALLVGGLAAATLVAVGIVPYSPYGGIVAFVLSLAVCGIGLYFKKRYCPRCREGVCDLERHPDKSSRVNSDSPDSIDP